MLKHVRLAFLFAFLLFWAVPAVLMAQAQDARGNIVGRTTDASGAVIPGADVKALNAAPGALIDASNFFEWLWQLRSRYSARAPAPLSRRSCECLSTCELCFRSATHATERGIGSHFRKRDAVAFYGFGLSKPNHNNRQVRAFEFRKMYTVRNSSIAKLHTVSIDY